MKAAVLYRTGGAEVLTLTDVTIPQVKPGWVLVRVKAFGINHSELMLRGFEGDAPYIHLPRIPGIECAGEVAAPSDSSFREGQKVIALMGGMGRSFDGSYAEYALLPIKNLFAVETDLSWHELAAIPETYFTAYGSLFQSLKLQPEDILLIRGGTSAAGLAAIQLAKSIGTTVIASTRNKSKHRFLKTIGADYVLIDDGTLPIQLHTLYPEGVTKILELVGASTLSESLRLTTPHGIICHTGVLGKKGILEDFDPIKDIPNGVYLTGFFSNYPTREIIDTLFRFIQQHSIRPVIARVFSLVEIAQAHILAESNQANGKIVIKTD